MNSILVTNYVLFSHLFFPVFVLMLADQFNSRMVFRAQLCRNFVYTKYPEQTFYF